MENYGAALPASRPPPYHSLGLPLYLCWQYQIEYVSFHATVIDIILETLGDETKFHRTQFSTTRELSSIKFTTLWSLYNDVRRALSRIGRNGGGGRTVARGGCCEKG